jgi:flagellin-like hook-associated protein FlgL
MSYFPSGIARAPSFLLSKISTSSLGRTNLAMFRTTSELSTGRSLLRPSDDLVKAAAVAELDDRLERSAQVRKNLEFAQASVNGLDSGLSEVTDLLEQAKGIALSQISEGSDADERSAQAVVIQSIIDSMFGVSNRKGVSGYVFGGATPGRQPVDSMLGSFRIGTGSGGLLPDTAGLGQVPITIRSPEAVRGIPGVVLGKVDLEPQLTEETRLDDLRGGRRLGITAGQMEYSFAGGPTQTIDLSNTDTIGDVIDAIEASLLQYEEDNDVEVLGPGGIAVSGTSIAIDSPFGNLVFADVEGGVVAKDLGLVTDASSLFGPARASGADLAPRVTTSTRVDQLGAVGASLGAIRVTNNGQTAEIDLAGAETIGEIKSRIEGAGLGLRVRVNADGDGIDIINEVAGGSARALSIAEVDGNNNTAAMLGIKTFAAQSRVSDLNHGRGVSIANGHTDPHFNVDFVITVDDAAGVPLDIKIDLSPEDLTTVGNVVEVMQDQIDAALTAAGRPTTDLRVSIGTTDNGIVLTQSAAITAGAGGPLEVTRRNNSLAAIDLGLVDGTWDATESRWVGSDRGKVRVDSVFTHLIDLRESLEGNDEFGMQLATESLDVILDDVTQTRALVGGYAKRIERQMTRQEDREVLDEQVRSTLRDVDFAKAATEFSLLQVQLQAGLQTAALQGQLTLLNFL